MTLDEEVMKQVVSEETADAGEREREKESAARALWRVVRSRALRARLALCAWSWVAVAFVYYGLTINSVALAGDKYVNFALNMAMEVVASLLLAMALERLGRRRAVCGAFLLCGAACVAPFFIGTYSQRGRSERLHFYNYSVTYISRKEIQLARATSGVRRVVKNNIFFCGSLGNKYKFIVKTYRLDGLGNGAGSVVGKAVQGGLPQLAP